MTPMYYVSYGSKVDVDLRRRVKDHHKQLSLTVFHRSGVAWFYRGVLIGAARNKGHWCYSKKHKSNVWYRPWHWRAWRPGAAEFGVELDLLPARSIVCGLPDQAGLVKAWVDSTLRTTNLNGNALDGIPWAIHKVENDAARTAAIEAYVRNRD